MQHAQREFYKDEDFIYEESDMSDTQAAFNCGLQGISYLGIASEETDLAFLRGRTARNHQPIINDPAAPPHFPSATTLA
jgi:hypothetical protein